MELLVDKSAYFLRLFLVTLMIVLLSPTVCQCFPHLGFIRRLTPKVRVSSIIPQNSLRPATLRFSDRLEINTLVKGGKFVEGNSIKIELKKFHEAGIPVISFNSGDSDIFKLIRYSLENQLKAKEIQSIDTFDQVFVDYDIDGHSVIVEWEHFSGVSISVEDDPVFLNQLFKYFQSMQSKLNAAHSEVR